MAKYGHRKAKLGNKHLLHHINRIVLIDSNYSPVLFFFVQILWELKQQLFSFYPFTSILYCAVYFKISDLRGKRLQALYWFRIGNKITKSSLGVSSVCLGGTEFQSVWNVLHLYVHIWYILIFNARCFHSHDCIKIARKSQNYLDRNVISNENHIIIK